MHVSQKRISLALPERSIPLFDAKVSPPDQNGCWNWTGSKLRGYGQFGVNQKTRYAHRISYERHRGLIPEGMDLDHLCRNPGCVNPDHLEPVTHRENLLRSESVAGRNARKITCDKGHDLVKRPSGWRVCKVCEQIGRRKRFAESAELRALAVRRTAEWRARNPEKYRALNDRKKAKRQASSAGVV